MLEHSMEVSYPSPDGKYLFQIDLKEMRMSHWVESPCLVITANNEVVFNLMGTNWSFDSAEWRHNERVMLKLHRYPGDHVPSYFEVLIDCLNQQATIQDDIPIAVADLEKELEATYARCQRWLPSASTSKPTFLDRLKGCFSR